MLKNFLRLLPALLLTLSSPALHAQDASGSENQIKAEAYLKAQAAKLHPQHGKITLSGSLVTLDLPPEFGYLPPDQTEILVTNIWQNPPGMKTLGAIVPDGVNFLSRDSWAVLITYNDDGHIKDDDAASVDYNQQLQQMKQANKEDMERRRAEGYAPFELIGWATQPHYDQANHKLYWALELKGEDSQESVNYHIRILGRQGYLLLDMVGSMQQLPVLEKNADKILSFVNFNNSQRYADFNPATDKVAAYGMAALVAGYAAAKIGMFKMLIPFLLAIKKFIILGAVAVAAFFRKIFGRKKKED